MKRLLILLVLIAAFCPTIALAQASPQTFARIRDATVPGSLANVRAFTLTFPSTRVGLLTLSGNYFFDGANMRLWGGAQANGDGIVATTYAPYVLNLNLEYDTVAGTWDRQSRHAYGDGLSAVQEGTDTLSYTLFYDTGNTVSRRWLGDEMSSDAVVTTTIAPYVGGLTHFYDSTGDDWSRLYGGTLSDALAAAPTLSWTGSFNLFYDGTNYRRWLGAQMNSDAIANTTYAPYVGSFLHGWDASGGQWYRLQLDPTGYLLSNQTTTAPGYGRIQDGDSTVLADVIDAGTDTLANTLNGVVTDGRDYYYDSTGAVWVRVQGDEGYKFVQLRSYTEATNSDRSQEINPVSEHHVEETLLDLTNIAQSTTAYAYFDMDGYRYFSSQIETSGAAPTDVLTVTLECSNQDDGTAPASCDYQDVTNAICSVASYVDTDGYCINSVPLAAKYCRWKYTTSGGGGNDADLTIYHKKMW